MGENGNKKPANRFRLRASWIFMEAPGYVNGAKAGATRRFGSQVLRRWLIGAAEEAGIPYQSGLVHGGNDAHAIQQTKSGIPACTIAVPRRYSHSPVELFSWDDLDNLIKVLTKAIAGLDSGFKLNRI